MDNSKNIYTSNAIEQVLPERLKFFRLKSGLTTNDVGNALQKNPSTVTCWETGKALLDINTLLRLCNMYKVADLNEFIDPQTPVEIKYLARSEQELIKLWRNTPPTTRAAIKTILKQCSKSAK